MVMSILDEDAGKRTPGRSGLWAVVLLPFTISFLLIAGVLSFPYGWYIKVGRDRRERSFIKGMSAAGRSMEWPEFELRLQQPTGTLIREILLTGWPGGRSRYWWTPEDVYSLCPHPIADFESMIGKEFEAAADWCGRRYTGIQGSAFILLMSEGEAETLFDGGRPFRRLPTHRMNWVDYPLIP
jgi:hypothetical protein